MAEVALITSSYFPRVGGVEEHVRSVAAGLRQRGIDVVVWTVDQGDRVPPWIDGVRVRALPCPLPARTVRSVLSFAWRGPIAALRWIAALIRDRPAILHVHCFGPNGVWALAASVGRPLIVTSHGESKGDATGAFDRSLLLPWAFRRALARADRVSVVAPSTRDDLVARFGLDEQKSVIITNGVDLEQRAGTLPPRLPKRYVLGIGRLVDIKGFDLLIDAFAAASLPQDVALVIVGDGIERQALAECAERAGIGARVLFTGALGREGVAAVAAAALVLAVPSRVETFGIVVLEGWRAGIPVVATSRGGPADLIHDGVDGFLVDPEDRAEFAALIARLVADPGASCAVAARGRERATDFSWDSVVSGYLGLYAALHRDDHAATIGPWRRSLR